MKRIVSLLLLAAPIASVACTIGETKYVDQIYPAQKSSAVAVCKGPFKQVDISTLEKCHADKGKGHCYDGKHIPTADQLLKCDKAGEVCVPDEFIEAQGKKLKSCKSIVGDGACVQIGLIPEMEKRGKAFLKQDSCDEGMVCAPCLNPEAGNAPTGLCEEVGAYEGECTGGTAVKSEPCCHFAGTCLAKDGLPPENRDQLDAQECKGGQVCAPASMVSGKGQKCDALGVSGMCLDTCFAGGMLDGVKNVAQGGCRATEVCMPCFILESQGMKGC